MRIYIDNPSLSTPKVFIALTEEEHAVLSNLIENGTYFAHTPKNILLLEPVQKAYLPAIVKLEFALSNPDDSVYELSADKNLCEKYKQIPRTYIFNLIRYVRHNQLNLGLIETNTQLFSPHYAKENILHVADTNRKPIGPYTKNRKRSPFGMRTLA